MKTRYCCPHCGWTYDPQAEKGWSFVPIHMKAQTPGSASIRCPGSGQAPRNADSDKRPLWQDGGSE